MLPPLDRWPTTLRSSSSSTLPASQLRSLVPHLPASLSPVTLSVLLTSRSGCAGTRRLRCLTDSSHVRRHRGDGGARHQRLASRYPGQRASCGHTCVPVLVSVPLGNGLKGRALCSFCPDVPACDADAKDSQTSGGGQDGEQEEREEDVDEEPVFTCDNCQRDFDCLGELTEHRTHHCPAGRTPRARVCVCV